VFGAVEKGGSIMAIPQPQPLSPGVYVREVPSAEQPITGVGTSTAAFIGIVEDEIKVPVVNEKYDPTQAAKAAAGPELNQPRITELEAKVKDLEERKAKAEQALAEIKEKLKKPNINDKEKKEWEKKQDDTNTEIQHLRKEISDLKKEIAELKKPQDVDAAAAKPYKLETFKLKAEPGVPKLCTNSREYRKRFGDCSADDENVPGKALHPGHRALTHAVYGFFDNGGKECECYVIRIKNIADLEKALETIESIDAVALVAAPGMVGDANWGALTRHCETCEDRFAILDCQEEVGAGGELDIKLLNYDNANNVLPKTNKNAAFYFPYIQVIDTAKRLQDQDPARKIPEKHWGEIYVPPSGHMAGIYARTDKGRGVHKAPANEVVRGAASVKYFIGRPKHGMLNPQGVNVIRKFNDDILVWGARTIGGDKMGEWKFVPVRRLFLYLRESIDEGTQWVVFEPNDMTLWGKIKRNVTAFLTNVWRSGALFGASPQEAFYVKCDEETNPPEVRALGMVVTEIGVAIVRPAEFVIFNITQAGDLKSI
jgi:phage tail sheath protein FI